MKKFIESGKVCGIVRAPTSKSMFQRAIAISTLADGKTTLRYTSLSEDVLAALGVAKNLGAGIEMGENEIHISPNEHPIVPHLDCAESGLCARMFAPICALFHPEITLTGSGSLLQRPMTMMPDALHALGASVLLKNGHLPITIKGPLHGGNITVDGSESSQFLTGLLLALPCAPQPSRITILNLKSRPYVDMTLDVVKGFGATIFQEADDVFDIPGQEKYRAQTYDVEGDFSGASFLLAAGAIGGDVTVTGLKTPNLQADAAILQVLTEMGAQVDISAHSVRVRKHKLQPFTIDATNCPDLFPPLVALASYCEGTSYIFGVHRLKYKESDRAVVLQTEFEKLGVRIEIDNDTMKTTPLNRTGGVVASHNDHRIAMAAAVFAIGLSNGDGVEILSPNAIRKSYPQFYDDLKTLQTGCVI